MGSFVLEKQHSSLGSVISLLIIEKIESSWITFQKLVEHLTKTPRPLSQDTPTRIAFFLNCDALSKVNHVKKDVALFQVQKTADQLTSKTTGKYSWRPWDQPQSPHINTSSTVPMNFATSWVHKSVNT